MRLYKIIAVGILSFSFLTGKAQPIFTKADTLRGSLNENRNWFDIQHYALNVTPNYETKSIIGQVIWTANTLTNPSEKVTSTSCVPVSPVSETI